MNVQQCPDHVMLMLLVPTLMEAMSVLATVGTLEMDICRAPAYNIPLTAGCFLNSKYTIMKTQSQNFLGLKYSQLKN